MADLEDRVRTLEARVDRLDVAVRHAADLGVDARRDAVAAQEAHHRNIDLLNALRETQAEHTSMLAEHSRMHAEHRDRFDAIDGKLGQLTLGMHTIESLLRQLIDQH